jgi:hypothetical protein
MYILFIMKRFIILISLSLGVMAAEGKPKYRIESWVYNGTTYYLPQQKIWYRTNYFPLPFKVWRSGSYPFQHQSQALEIIENWKFDRQSRIDYRRSKYVMVD